MVLLLSDFANFLQFLFISMTNKEHNIFHTFPFSISRAEIISFLCGGEAERRAVSFLNVSFQTNPVYTLDRYAYGAGCNNRDMPAYSHTETRVKSDALYPDRIVRNFR